LLLISCRVWASDPGCGGYNVIDISVHLAACLRANLTCIDATLPRCTGAVYHGSTGRRQQGTARRLLTGWCSFSLRL